MSEMICYCKKVTRETIEAAIINGAKSLKDIQETTGACTGNACKILNPTGKCCSEDIIEILRAKGIVTDDSSCCNSKSCSC